MFIMSLAIADLTVGVIVMPISAAYAITGRINSIFLHSLEEYSKLLLFYKKICKKIKYLSAYIR